MAQLEDFLETKTLMGTLWPRWKPDAVLASLLNERWGQLHQDKLRECIRQHRLEREMKPDISAIHKAYCKITGDTASTHERVHAVTTTRRAAEQCVGPTDAELAGWDAWADEVMATSTAAEIDNAVARLGISPSSSRRVIAVAVDYCRTHPHAR